MNYHDQIKKLAANTNRNANECWEDYLLAGSNGCVSAETALGIAEWIETNGDATDPRNAAVAKEIRKMISENAPHYRP